MAYTYVMIKTQLQQSLVLFKFYIYVLIFYDIKFIF